MATALVLSGCITVDYRKLHDDAVRAQYEMIQRYVAEKRFGQPIPKLDGAALEKFLDSGLTPKEKADIRAAVEQEYERGRTQTVFPKWVEFRRTAIAGEIDALVQKATADAQTNGYVQARAKFEAAREAGWQGSVKNVDLGGKIVPEVYGPLHKSVVDIMDERIGVAEWPVVKREMSEIATNALRSAELEKGIAALKAYKPIRAYTAVLDERVKALVNELARMKVPAAATRRILANTEKWMRAYEHLSDVTEVTKSDTKTEGGTPDVRENSQYKKLLEEYRKSLRLYDCTDENTQRIIAKLAEFVTKVVDELPKGSPAKTVQFDRLVKLGATALNRRMDALREQLVRELEKAVADSKAMGEELDKALRGDPAKAFAKVVDVLSGVEQADASARALAMRKLLTEINPALWEKMEKEIRARVARFAAEGKCAEGIKWLEKYPGIRTYAEDIDDKFAAVAKAAEGFGVPAATAQNVMDKVAGIAAEMARLADYTDKICDEVTPGHRIPAEKLAAFEKSVAACRESLIRNGCTVENADKITGAIKMRFAEEQAIIEADVHTSVFYLGSNALNRRLKNLKEACAGELLGRCVSALVVDKRFADARALLRDIPLTGNKDFDGKVYTMRVGVLNTVVNPVQLEMCKTEIRDALAEFWKKGDYRAARKWMDAYPYVHDTYPDILKAAKAIQDAMENLKIDEPDPEKYMAKVLGKVRDAIEAAKSDYVLPAAKYDLSELERALSLFEQAYVAQYYKEDVVKATRDQILDDVKKFLRKEVVALSTADVNRLLRASMEEEVRRLVAADAEARRPRYRLADDPVQADFVKQVVLDAAKKGFVAMAAGKEKDAIYAEIAGAVATPAIDWLRRLWDELNAPKAEPTAADAAKMAFADLMDQLVKHQEYLELLAAMDKEVAYDSQIAMAEDAIAKQLCETTFEGHLKMNALLGEYARAMRLLKQGKTLAKDQGVALLSGAVYLDQPAVFSRALELGADVNAVSARDTLRRTPLLLAIQLGRTAFIHRLVSSGAEVTVPDANGDTAVHYAVRRGSLAILQAMLGKNDVDAVNKAGETALFDAARNNEPALVEMLVAAKANVAAKNARGWTAFDVACAEGSRDVLEPLAAAGAEFGPLQLGRAAWMDHLAVAQWLVSRGVDVNGPHVVAASNDSPAVRAYLLQQGGVIIPGDQWPEDPSRLSETKNGMGKSK